MRKRICRPALFLLVLLAFLTFSMSAAASEALEVSTEGYGTYIEDEADLLTDAEEQELVSYMRNCTAYGHTLFKTVAENPYGSTDYLANRTYYDHFGNESGVMLLIDMDERMVYINSSGACYRMLPKSKTDTVTDNIYMYATRGDYFGCAAEAFTELGLILDGDRVAQPMRYISAAILSLLLSMFLSFIVCYSRSGIKKTGKKDLLAPAEIVFRAMPARFIHTNTTVRYDPPVESSGGGGHGGGGGHSGGGGGGGGGFSGGGSGHHF